MSIAASLGVLLSRTGFSVRLATADTRPASLTQERLLEKLAAVIHSHNSSLAQALVPFRSTAGGDSTFVVVTAPPSPRELAALTRIGSAFGPKLAVLVYAVDPAALPSEGQSQLEGRASVARLSLSRAGWEVVVLTPGQRFKDVWQANKTNTLFPIGSSR